MKTIIITILTILYATPALADSKDTGYQCSNIHFWEWHNIEMIQECGLNLKQCNKIRKKWDDDPTVQTAGICSFKRNAAIIIYNDELLGPNAVAFGRTTDCRRINRIMWQHDSIDQVSECVASTGARHLKKLIKKFIRELDLK